MRLWSDRGKNKHMPAECLWTGTLHFQLKVPRLLRWISMIIYGALEKNLLGVSDIVHFKRIPILTWILAVQTPRKGFFPPKKIHKINEYEHVFRRDTNFLSDHIIKYLFQHCGFWICPWHCERVNFPSLYMHQKIDCCISLWIIHCTVLQHVSGIQRILLLLRMNHHKLHILHELSGAKKRSCSEWQLPSESIYQTCAGELYLWKWDQQSFSYTAAAHFTLVELTLSFFFKSFSPLASLNCEVGTQWPWIQMR